MKKESLNSSKSIKNFNKRGEDMELVKEYLGLIMPAIAYAGVLIANPEIVPLTIIWVVLLIVVFAKVWSIIEQKNLDGIFLSVFAGLYGFFFIYYLNIGNVANTLIALFYLVVMLITVKTIYHGKLVSGISGVNE